MFSQVIKWWCDFSGQATCWHCCHPVSRLWLVMEKQHKCRLQVSLKDRAEASTCVSGSVCRLWTGAEAVSSSLMVRSVCHGLHVRVTSDDPVWVQVKPVFWWQMCRGSREQEALWEGWAQSPVALISRSSRRRAGSGHQSSTLWVALTSFLDLAQVPHNVNTFKTFYDDFSITILFAVVVVILFPSPFLNVDTRPRFPARWLHMVPKIVIFPLHWNPGVNATSHIRRGSNMFCLEVIHEGARMDAQIIHVIPQWFYQ